MCNSPWYYPAFGTSDMVVVGGPDWPWDETSGEGEPETFDYEYNAKEPPPHEIIRQDWWETVTTAYWDHSWLNYWGWCPGGLCTEPEDIGDLPQGLGLTLDEARSSLQANDDATPIQFGRIAADYGVDQDGDSHFDQLVLEATVDVNEAGAYWFYALLGSDQRGGEMVGTGGAVSSAAVQIDLEPGRHIVRIPFSGLGVFSRRADGPYYLMNLWVTDFQTNDREKIMLHALDSLDGYPHPYTTAHYHYQAFETPLAEFSDSYDEQSLGRFDKTLIIDVGLEIYEPGRYTVSGELYDAQDQFVDQATWSGYGDLASLRFEGLTGAGAPYSLKFLQLFDNQDNLLDTQYLAYTAQVQSAIRIARPQEANQILGDGITPTQIFAETPVDLDGDDLFDLLNIEVQVEVSQARSYRVEGWLVDRYDDLVAYELSSPTLLPVGTHTLTLSFDGRQLYGQGLYSYTLMALKVMDGSSYNVRDEIKVAYTTASYDRAQFQPPSTAQHLFEDDMESGEGGWSAQAPWAITSNAYHSPLYAWDDSPGGDYGNDANTSLTIAQPLDASGLAEPVLRFQTCYAFEEGDYGFVEVSDNGGATWSPVSIYTTLSPYWLAEFVDLSDFEGAASLQIRFRLDSDASGTADGWYIDDVILTGWPSPINASFSYDPQVPLVDELVTFVAQYSPPDLEPPITFTWDFGDGSPLWQDSIPTATHTYDQSGDYTVWLTVSNPSGYATHYDSLTVVQPVLGTSFSYMPTEPGLGETVYFSATYTPHDATPPITYTWNFSGTLMPSSTSPFTSYAFVDHVGPHPVWLTTTNGYGPPVSYMTFVGVGCTALVSLTFSYEPVEPNASETVTFSADYAPTGMPLTFTWDFGDGSSQTIYDDPTVTHAFDRGDDFSVEIRAETDGCGWLDHEQSVTIHQAVLTASFDYQPAAPLVNQPVTFVASYGPETAPPSIEYTWDFGDGHIEVTPIPTITHSYDSSDYYTVQVTVGNIDGSAQDSQVIYIIQPLEGVYFTYTPDLPYPGEPVTLTAYPDPEDASPPITYTWDFDDGSPPLITNDQIVAHNFPGGRHTVQLTATNGHGHGHFQDNVLVPVAVTGVDFSYTLPITYGVPAVLVAQAEPVSATRPIQYHWDFGDGLTTTKTVPTVTHTFVRAGDLVVQLTASNIRGSASHSQTLPVNGYPVETAFFDVDTDPALAHEPVTFIGYGGPSEATPPIYMIWNFGEGPTPPTTDSITYYTFTNPGLYTTWLTATNDYGYAVYSHTVNVLSHRPDWQKQIWVNGEGPYDPDDAFSGLQQGDEIVIADWVSFGYTQEPISFTLTEAWGSWLALTDVITQGGGSLSSGVDTLTWEVINGSPDTQYALTKTFQIANDDWEMETLTETLWSDSAIPPWDPIVVEFYHEGVCVPIRGVSFSYDPATPEISQTVSFSATADRGDPPITYTWDLGDGTGGQGAPFSHTYTQSGTYTVVLTGANCGGSAWDVYTNTLTVVAPLPPCTQVQGVTLTQITPGPIYTDTAVAFSADLAPDDLDTPYNYRLILDGVPGEALVASDDPLVFSYTFATTGSHAVRLAAWNCEMPPDQAVASTPVQIEVRQPGTCVELTDVALSLVTSGTLQAGRLIQFSADLAPDDASTPYSYTIDHGDGSAPANGNGSADPYLFNYTFADAGVYTVSISVWNCAMTTPITAEPLQVVVSASGYTIYLPIVVREN